MEIDDVLPSKGTHCREITAKGCRFLVVEITEPLPTVAELIARLAQNQPVMVRAGQRGQLTSALKARKIFTHQKTVQTGWLLFTPCEPREFKQ